MREPAPDASTAAGVIATADVSEEPKAEPNAAAPVDAVPPVKGEPDRLGRGFRALLAAMFVANLGSGITVVAFPWLTAELTRDPLLIAGVAMAAELPWLLFSLPAGVLVDRSEHRRLISWTHVGRAAVVGLLAIAVFTGVTDLWMLYVVAFTLGALTVLNENAAQTILPRVVRPSQLNRANSNLMLADTTGGVFLGPAIGGWLLVVSATLPFALDAGLFALAAGLMLLVTVTPRHRADAKPATDAVRRALRVEMVQGMRYFWRHRVLRQLGIFLGLLNLTSSIIVGTQVLYAQEILGLNPGQYGVLFAVGAVGAAVGAGVAPTLETRLGARRVLLTTLLGNSAISLAIGLTSSAFVVGAALAVGAGLAVVWNVVTISYRQRIVPEHLLGRVNSIYRLLAWGPLAVGSLLGGAVVKAGIPVLGREGALRVPMLLAAAITAVLLLYAALRLREGIWSMDGDAASRAAPQATPPGNGTTDDQPVDDSRSDVVAEQHAGGGAEPPSAAFGGTGGARRLVVKALIAVNVLVAAAGLALLAADGGLTTASVMYSGISPLHVLSEMNGAAVDRGQLWRLLTAMFVHYGFVHLVVNMVMLGLAGWRLEPVLGGRRFLCLYLLSGFGAGVATYLFAHGSLTAGASGANFGVFSALLLIFIRLRRRSVLAVVLLVVGVVSTFAVPGMAVAAHLAGLLVGAVVALGFALPTGAARRRVQRSVPIATVAVLVLVAALGMLL